MDGDHCETCRHSSIARENDRDAWLSQVFPFLIILPLVIHWFGAWDNTTVGVGIMILGSPLFWLQIIVIYFFTFGLRYEVAVCA